MDKEKIKNHFNNDYSIFYSKYIRKIKKIGGDEYSAICIFHDDTKPSFNFSSKTGQYFCHGCGKKGDIFHFFAKLNSLNTRSDFGKILKGIANDFGIPWEQQKKKTIARYVYTDQDGRPLHRTCRTEPKDFYQQQHDQGRWKSGLKGITPVLYRLPKVIAADEVLIVEGEKDCDNLAKLGFVATTCAMGAKKWRENYNESLKGKSIVLIPDNDNQGREHMVKVAASLNGHSGSIKFLKLQGLPSKGDASDFIAQFESSEAAAERLSILIENAGPYEPPKTYSIEDVILPVSEFREIEIEPRKALLYPWLKEESINMIYGWRGAGKTFFTLGILDAVTRGEPFGPWECNKSVNCLFIDGEMTITDDHERIDDLNLSSQRQSELMIYSDAYANRLGLPRAHLGNESWRTKIKSILIARKIYLFVLDNIASLASGLDENKKQDWDPVNQWLLELRFAGISTILLHHESKEGKQRGTAAREDNLDTSIRLKMPSDYVPEDGCRFVVHFAKGRIRTADLPLIADTEFSLAADEHGQQVWTYSNVKGAHKREVLKLLDEDLSQQAVCDSLDLSKGYVSKIRKRALKDGLLTPKNKLTQEGYLWVSNNEK